MTNKYILFYSILLKKTGWRAYPAHGPPWFFPCLHQLGRISQVVWRWRPHRSLSVPSLAAAQEALGKTWMSDLYVNGQSQDVHWEKTLLFSGKEKVPWAEEGLQWMLSCWIICTEVHTWLTANVHLTWVQLCPKDLEHNMYVETHRETKSIVKFYLTTCLDKMRISILVSVLICQKL